VNSKKLRASRIVAHLCHNAVFIAWVLSFKRWRIRASQNIAYTVGLTGSLPYVLTHDILASRKVVFPYLHISRGLGDKFVVNSFNEPRINFNRSYGGWRAAFRELPKT